MTPLDLRELNRCMVRFDVQVHWDASGRARLWGDINRMQEVVDSECGRLIGTQMHQDFVSQFREIDARIAQRLMEKGVQVEYDPERGLNVPEDVPAEVIDDCINGVYALYRDPPTDNVGSALRG